MGIGFILATEGASRLNAEAANAAKKEKAARQTRQKRKAEKEHAATMKRISKEVLGKGGVEKKPTDQDLKILMSVNRLESIEASIASLDTKNKTLSEVERKGMEEKRDRILKELGGANQKLETAEADSWGKNFWSKKQGTKTETAEAKKAKEELEKVEARLKKDDDYLNSANNEVNIRLKASLEKERTELLKKISTLKQQKES